MQKNIKWHQVKVLRRARSVGSL